MNPELQRLQLNMNQPQNESSLTRSDRPEVPSAARSIEGFAAVYMSTETRYTSPPLKAGAGVCLGDLAGLNCLNGTFIKLF